MLLFLIIVIILLIVSFGVCYFYYQGALEHNQLLYRTVSTWYEYLLTYQIESKELWQLYKEYNDLLIQELNDTVGMAALHGWKSNRVEEGEILRNKIQEYETKLAKYIQ